MSWEGPDKWRDEDGDPDREDPPATRSFCIATGETCECPYGGATESHCAAKILDPIVRRR